MKQYNMKIVYKDQLIGEFAFNTTSESNAIDRAFKYTDNVLALNIDNYDKELVEIYVLDNL